MASFIRNPKDLWSGLIFVAFGLAAIVIGQDYSMGSAGRMGPAYFPTILGSLLVIIGAIAILRSFVVRASEAMGHWAIKQAALIIVGTLLFGLLVRNAGLVIAIAVLVMLAGFASIKFKVSSYALLAAGMATFCVLVFVKALGLPMPILGPWLGF